MEWGLGKGGGSHREHEERQFHHRLPIGISRKNIVTVNGGVLVNYSHMYNQIEQTRTVLEETYVFVVHHAKLT